MQPVLKSLVRHRLTAYYRSERWVKPVIIIILAFCGVFVFYPFLWMLLSSFKTGADIVSLPPKLMPKEWTLGGYLMLFGPGKPDLLRGFMNSLLVTTGTIVTVLFTSSLGGYVFARLDFPGRKYLFYFVLSTTMVPFLTLLIPLYLVINEMGLINSLVALWLPGIFAPFGIFLCRQFIYSIPRDMYDSAKIDGASDWAIYLDIILPLTKPVLSVLTIFTFLGSFNSYLWPLVILNDQAKLTLPLLLTRVFTRFGGVDYQAMMAASVLAFVPPFIVFLVFQKYIVSGIALTGMKEG